MLLRDPLLEELDQEAAATRRVLERLPEDRWLYKPHEKSWPMNVLGSHVAQIPRWLSMTIDFPELDLAPGGVPNLGPPPAESPAELLSRFDAHAGSAKSSLSAADDERLLANWSLLKNGQALLTLPRIRIIRTFVLNHLVHHRAQLTVYLRLLDVPVPSIYGPSADDAGMF